MLIKEAQTITGGGLSATSKGKKTEINTAWRSYSIPAWRCNVGSKLEGVNGSTCKGCYAKKNRYAFGVVAEAMERRYQSIEHPQWVEAMTTLISKQSKDYFRWHDSGDIQDREHLDKILEVCRNTPDTQHWIPTREYKLMLRTDPDTIPDNVTFRISAPMIDGPPPKINGLNTSTVHTSQGQGQTCPAPKQEGECRDCRACWNKDVPNVSYAIH